MVSIIRKIRAALLAATFLFSSQASAQEAAPKSAAKAAEIDRFNVKSQDLGDAPKQKSKEEDIPMPDFKEIPGGPIESVNDDLFDEDNPDALPKAPKKAAKAEERPAVEAAAPAPVAPLPEPVAAPELPVAPAEAAKAPLPDAAGSLEGDMLGAVPPAQPAPAEAAAPAVPENAAPVAQTEQEIEQYKVLKAHLLSFLKGVAERQSAEKAKTDTVAAVPPEGEAAEPIPAPAPADAPDSAPVAPETPQEALPTKGASGTDYQKINPDDFNDPLLMAAPVPAQEPAPVQPAEPTPPAKEEAKPVVAPAPEVAKAPEPAPAPVVLKDEPAKPAVKTVTKKLSDADKADIAKIDEKAKKLPENKKLSDSTRKTIDKVTPSLAEKEVVAGETEYIDVEHGKKFVPGEEKDGETKSRSMNISIKDGAKSSKGDNTVGGKLDMAYRALLSGQIAASVSIYKEVLAKDTDNKDALFGLATAYHRDSQFDQARTIYTKILEKDPNNKEVLNNFLVLVAEESPDAALLELQKVEKINSDFSPIPAQIAMIYLKKNDLQKAERYLKRAVMLSPDNVTYQYNLAITSDRLENYPQAVKLYKQIISSVKSGAVIPGSLSTIEERLSFLEDKIK